VQIREEEEPANEVSIHQFMQQTETTPMKMKYIIDNLYDKEKKFIY
jgi:hypothetical protein